MTLTQNEKAMEIFELTKLGHIVIRAEAYKAQGGLTVRNLVMARPTADTPIMWCGGGHLHRGWPQ
jgi:hypothetical protein